MDTTLADGIILETARMLEQQAFNEKQQQERQYHERQQQEQRAYEERMHQENNRQGS